MNIYFACSITGGRNDEAVYQVIVDTLLTNGHVVPTALLARPEVVMLDLVSDATTIYSQAIAWIQESDALIVEITTPSHGVGYEIAYALGLGKRVLCLYRDGARVSKMISGIPDPNLTIQTYTNAEEIAERVKRFLE